MRRGWLTRISHLPLRHLALAVALAGALGGCDRPSSDGRAGGPRSGDVPLGAAGSVSPRREGPPGIGARANGSEASGVTAVHPAARIKTQTRGGIETIAMPLTVDSVSPRPGGKSLFVDVSREAGVVHRHQKGIFDPKLRSVLPWISAVGAAAAVSDYDGDGDTDLYVTTSRAGVPNALFRNEGRLRFENVAGEAGVASVNGRAGVSTDVAFCDLDNDGDDDLYVVKWGRDQLFRNNGDGTFSDVTEEAGVGERANGTCVLPFDYDSDGLLDLLICNYFPPVDLQNLDTTLILPDSFEAARNGGANRLYRNLGGLRFEDVAPELRLDDSGWSLDAGISDIDNDGDADLYVANDFGQDRLFLNNGDGTFTECTARGIGHENSKSRSVDFGDVDNDGLTDGYVSNITSAAFLKEGNRLWLNLGGGNFADFAGTTDTSDGGWSWCARFFDYDHDGDLDILAVNGFVTAGRGDYWEDLAVVAVDPDFQPRDAKEWPAMGARSLSGSERTRLFRNNGDGSFEDVAEPMGIADRRDGRGIALADFDRDGDLDVYVANQNTYGALYRNDAAVRKRWVVVSLVGTRSNRNAIGARVQVTCQPSDSRVLVLTREVNGVNGCASQSTYQLHFGLGAAQTIEKLTVFWPSGVIQEFESLATNRHYRLTEEGSPSPVRERRKRYFANSRGGKAVAAVTAESPTILLELEKTLLRLPRHPVHGNRYRYECVRRRCFDRSIRFFRRLLHEHGPLPALRLQLAVALVDKIPSVPRDAFLQASLAKESLYELAQVEERYPRSYAVHYVAGMNHLYWPAGFKHYDDAIRHFEICLEIQEERAAAGRPPERHYSEIYGALGDAHVKGKHFAKARQTWEEGLRLFPNHPFLKARLATSDGALFDSVRRERGLKKRIETRLKMLHEEHGLREAETRIAANPQDRQVLNHYRLEARELDQTERCLTFLTREAELKPGASELRLHLGLAYADRASEIGRSGTQTLALREEALEELERYSSGKPAEWLGQYLLGILRLHMPLPGGSAREAAPPLEKAVELARRPRGDPRVPYPALALGDAWVLAGKFQKAREVWRAAAETFPHAEALTARLKCADSSLVTFVRLEYDPGRGMWTDLERLAEHEEELEALEKSLWKEPSRRLGDRYRSRALGGDDPGRAVRFFRRFVAERPDNADMRVQLVLALVDRTPDRRLGTIRKGLLSSDALSVLEKLIRAHPRNWGLHYLRGSIHLNWFPKLKHVSQAIDSFERCLRLLRDAGDADSHGALVYQAIGDACVLQRQFVVGRTRYWKRGRELYPADPGLRERWDLTSLMVNDFVTERRSWATVQDTPFSDLIGDLGIQPEVKKDGR